MSYNDSVGEMVAARREKVTPHRKIVVNNGIVDGKGGYLVTVMPNPKSQCRRTDEEIHFFIEEENLKAMLNELLGKFNKYSIPTVLQAVANDRDHYMDSAYFGFNDAEIGANLRKAAVRETIIWRVKKYHTASELEEWLSK